MNNFMDQYFSANFMQGLQNFVIAIIVLLVGWLIAKAIGNAVEKAFKKSKLDERFINMKNGKRSKNYWKSGLLHTAISGIHSIL